MLSSLCIEPQSTNPKTPTVACNALEQLFNSSKRSIELLLRLVGNSGILGSLRSFLRRQESFVLKNIELTLKDVEKQIKNISGVSYTQTVLNSSCKAFYECKAFANLMVDSLPFETDEERQNILNNYEQFEKIVCRLNINTFLTNWRVGAMGSLKDILNGITEDLNFEDIIRAIEEYEERYNQFLVNTKVLGKNIFEWLEFLDTFKNCGKAFCDIVNSVANLEEEVASKTFLRRSVEGQRVIYLEDITRGILQKNADINKKINELNIEIGSYLDCSKGMDSKEGTPKSDLMRG